MFFGTCMISHTDPKRQFSSSCSTHDNFTTTISPMSTPHSPHKLEVISEGYTEDTEEKMAESSFTESAAAMKYRIRLVEDAKLLTGGNEMMVSEAKDTVEMTAGT